MLDHIAFAEENPTEYRILFLSVRPPSSGQENSAGDTGKQSGFPLAVQVRAVVP